MKALMSLLFAAAVICGFAVPGGAQMPYPYPQQQPGSGLPEHGYYPQPFHGRPAYGYNENSLIAFVDRLLGNRYGVADRAAVQDCASAAMQMAAVQYQPQSTGQGHPYGQGYNPAALMRVFAITDVQRRENGLRVSGLIDSRVGQPPYDRAYGHQINGYATAGDLSFRCDVDYSGIVYNLRVNRANTYRG